MGTPRNSKHSTSLGLLAIFEDDELFRMKLEKDLARQGLEYVSFSNVTDVKSHLEEKPFHAVLTDIYLESEAPNGLEVVDISRDLGLPCIIMTSALDLDVAMKGTNRGADYILEKPFEVPALVQLLRDLWENPRGLIGRRERCFDQHQLTPKEREFARMMLKGLSNKEIAEVLNTTVATVKFYSNQIFSKTGVGSRGELFNFVFPT